MAHAVLRIGYTNYVMPTDKAVVVAQALADAERYKSIYIPQSARGDSNVTNTYHIWPSTEGNENLGIELISDDLYRLAKMAGKPENGA